MTFTARFNRLMEDADAMEAKLAEKDRQLEDVYTLLYRTTDALSSSDKENAKLQEEKLELLMKLQEYETTHADKFSRLKAEEEVQQEKEHLRQERMSIEEAIHDLENEMQSVNAKLQELRRLEEDTDVKKLRIRLKNKSDEARSAKNDLIRAEEQLAALSKESEAVFRQASMRVQMLEREKNILRTAYEAKLEASGLRVDTFHGLLVGRGLIHELANGQYLSEEQKTRLAFIDRIVDKYDGITEEAQESSSVSDTSPSDPHTSPLDGLPEKTELVQSEHSGTPGEDTPIHSPTPASDDLPTPAPEASLG